MDILLRTKKTKVVKLNNKKSYATFSTKFTFFKVLNWI